MPVLIVDQPVQIPVGERDRFTVWGVLTWDPAGRWRLCPGVGVVGPVTIGMAVVRRRGVGQLAPMPPTQSNSVKVGSEGGEHVVHVACK